MHTARLLAIAGLAAVSASLHAQISFTGLYNQDFDSLGTTRHDLADSQSTALALGLAGWSAARTSSPTTNTDFGVDVWAASNANTAGLYNFGSTSEATDRSLGSVSYNTTYAFGARFTNSTGGEIDSLTISFDAEFWRTTASTIQSTAFHYGFIGGSINATNFLTATATSVSQLSVTAPSSASSLVLDGNLSGNRASISYTLTNLNWAPDQVLFIRWQDSDQSGHEAGIAIDNLSLSTVPEPSSFAALAGVLALGATVGLRRRRR